MRLRILFLKRILYFLLFSTIVNYSGFCNSPSVPKRKYSYSVSIIIQKNLSFNIEKRNLKALIRSLPGQKESSNNTVFIFRSDLGEIKEFEIKNIDFNDAIFQKEPACDYYTSNQLQKWFENSITSYPLKKNFDEVLFYNNSDIKELKKINGIEKNYEVFSDTSRFVTYVSDNKKGFKRKEHVLLLFFSDNQSSRLGSLFDTR